MIIDNYTIKGSSHEICEDSSLSYISGEVENIGINLNRATGIICDGCSSENNTHLGSSIIMYSAKKFLDIGLDDIKLIMSNSIDVCGILGIDKNCLYSTLLYLEELNETIKIKLYGDGVFVFKYDFDEQLKYCKFEYTHNAPFYPIYYYDKDLFEKYIEISKNEYLLRTNDGVKNSIKFQIQDSKEYTNYFCKDHLEFIAILSDGIFSFIDEKNKSCVYSDLELFNKLFDFKLINKNFIKRRLKRFIQDMSKEGYKNFDDISIAIFHKE